MIILAHVGPLAFVFQLRNFDVPLMVLVSGVSFSLSYKGETYLGYLVKRIKRLVFPVWIFLSGYFLFMYITGYPFALPGMNTIVTSYLLLEGIGYVWIIRVFLLVAIIAPAIMAFHRRTASHARYFTLLALAYATHEILLRAVAPQFGPLEAQVFENTVLYLIPYGTVFALGLRLPTLSRQNVLRLALGSFAAFALISTILFMLSGEPVPTQAFKYPPSIYYLSYALGVSGVLWLFADTMLVSINEWGPSVLTLVFFAARNSIWIYLWHIPFVEIVRLPSYLAYPAVFALAVLFTFAQVKLVKRRLLPKISNPSVRKNVNMILTG
jgi:hypothetical protein